MNQQIANNVYAVGVRNPDLRVFDVIMETEYGTTYNAYLIRGEKIALVDMSKNGFESELLQNIRDIGVQPEEIDYVIVNHTEPDHSGGVLAVLDAAPHAQVYGTRAALNCLQEIANRPLPAMAVKEGQTLDLGGITLQFIMAPFLHWPDTMFTYVQESQTLLSGDVFGAHYAELPIQQTHLEMAQRYYFDMIMGPFKPYFLQALDKIADLPIQLIGPSHGPVHTQDIRQLMAKQRGWCADALVKNDPKRVFIGYVSCYGYTRCLAEVMAEVILEKGYAVDISDVALTPANETAVLIAQADAILLGSPTVNKDCLPPVWNVMTGMSAIGCKGKPAGAFGSFGWSGEAGGMILSRLQGLGCKTLPAPCRCKLRPNDDEIQTAQAYARQLTDMME